MTEREIDAEVAKKVMGWTDFTESRFNGELLGLPEGVSRPKSGDTSSHEIIPRYCAKIEAAWQVGEKVGGAWGVSYYPGHAKFIAYLHPPSIENLTARGSAATASMAICLAALAVRWSPKQSGVAR